MCAGGETKDSRNCDRGGMKRPTISGDDRVGDVDHSSTIEYTMYKKVFYVDRATRENGHAETRESQAQSRAGNIILV